MNQCVVPSWGLLDDAPAVASGGGGVTRQQLSTTAAGGGAFVAPVVVVPMADQYYEVAELTWEKGSISSHGLQLHRPAVHRYPPAAPPPPPSQHQHELQAIGGGGGSSGGDRDRETLEAVVGEAAGRSHFLSLQPVVHTPAPWVVGVDGAAAAAAVARTAADALVPCGAAAAGDAAGASNSRRKRPRVDGGLVCAASQGSTAPGRCRGGESALLTLEACGGGADDACGFTTTTATNNSTSLELERDDDDDKGTPDTENTSIGGGASDSRCFSRRSQRDGLCDEGEENLVINGDGAMRSSISTKRSRAAAIHNESERFLYFRTSVLLVDNEKDARTFSFAYGLWAYTGRNQCASIVFSWANFASYIFFLSYFIHISSIIILCFVSETKGQDQPEDENAAKARAELEQDRQGVDAGRGDRLPEAAAGAGAGDEPDDDAHGHAAAPDVRHGPDGADGPDGTDGPGHDEHGLPRAAGLRGPRAAHDAPAPLRPHAVLGRRPCRRCCRRRPRCSHRNLPRPADRRRRRGGAGRLLRLPSLPSAAERTAAAATG